MPTRTASRELMEKYIANPALRNHSEMVAKAMEAYAKKLGLTDDEVDAWWTAGILHDLDWEMYPDEHPNKAVNEILPPLGYSTEILDAIKAHGPDRTGKYPEAPIERYLFACDEISGFIHASSLVRPTGYVGMEAKSVIKKLKDKHFAEAVSREDIKTGCELIGIELADHIQFLIDSFTQK